MWKYSSEHLSALYLNTLFFYHSAFLGAGRKMKCLHWAGSQPRAISCSNILQLTLLCLLVCRKEQPSFLSCRTFFPLFIFNDCALRECLCVSSSPTGQISLMRMKIAAEFEGLIQTFISKEKSVESTLGLFNLVFAKSRCTSVTGCECNLSCQCIKISWEIKLPNQGRKSTAINTFVLKLVLFK